MIRLSRFVFIALILMSFRSAGYGLHDAVKKGHLNTVKWMVHNLVKSSSKIDINTKDHDGNSALHIAIISNYPKIIEYLVEKKAKINVINNYHRTPLHYAVLGGILEMVKLLVKNGAKLNEKDSDGKTPLHYASENNHLEIIKYLFESRPRENIKEEKCSYCKKSFKKLYKCSKCLKTPYCGIKCQGEDWKMHKLVCIPYNKEFPKYINNKISPNIYYLHLAVKNNNFKKVKFAIKAGVDVNLQNNVGEISLHIATKQGYVQMTRYLIVNGATIYAIDDKGYTPLDYAIEILNSKRPLLFKKTYKNTLIANSFLQSKDRDSREKLLLKKKKTLSFTKCFLRHRKEILFFCFDNKIKDNKGREILDAVVINKFMPTDLIRHIFITCFNTSTNKIYYKKIKKIKEQLQYKNVSHDESIKKNSIKIKAVTKKLAKEKLVMKSLIKKRLPMGKNRIRANRNKEKLIRVSLSKICSLKERFTALKLKRAAVIREKLKKEKLIRNGLIRKKFFQKAMLEFLYLRIVTRIFLKTLLSNDVVIFAILPFMQFENPNIGQILGKKIIKSL